MGIRGAKVFDDWTVPEHLLKAMKQECEDLTGLRPDGESFLFPYVVGDRTNYEIELGLDDSWNIWHEVDGWLHRHGVYDGEQVLVVRIPGGEGVDTSDFEIHKHYDYYDEGPNP